MLIVGNVLAMMAVYANILGFLIQFLGALGIATMALCSLVVADYLVMRKGKDTSTRVVEEWNWAGIIAMTVGFGIAYTLQTTGIFPVGFVVALILVPLIYVVLRRTVLPEGTGTTIVPGTTALLEADDLDDEDVRSAALD